MCVGFLKKEISVKIYLLRYNVWFFPNVFPLFIYLVRQIVFCDIYMKLKSKLGLIVTLVVCVLVIGVFIYPNIMEVKKTVTKTVTKFQINVEFSMLARNVYAAGENETYIIEVKESEYFGVPNTSFLVTNNSFCNISDGSEMFKVIAIDSNNALVEFNEGIFYNYTRQLNYSQSKTWLDLFIYDYLYFDNPLTITYNMTLIYPIRGEFGKCGFDSCEPPNPYVTVYLSKVK